MTNTTPTLALASQRYDSNESHKHPVPLSVRYPWHRASLLGVLIALMVLPWTTSTGCSGDQPPVTESGFELFSHTLTTEPLFLLAPAALILATLLGIYAQRIARAGRRAWLSFAMLLLVVGGAFFTWFSMMAPHAAEHVEHHFASTAGTIACVALIFDALIRFMLGVREWFVAWRAARKARVACDLTRQVARQAVDVRRRHPRAR